MIYVAPADNDVLCGRGRVAFKNPGNKSLRQLIVTSLNDYISSSRSEKTVVIRQIVLSVMDRGGRFLKYDKDAEMWYDGGMAVAKSRVGSAFRDAATPDKVKCIEKMKETLRNGKTIDSDDATPQEASTQKSSLTAPSYSSASGRTIEGDWEENSRGRVKLALQSDKLEKYASMQAPHTVYCGTKQVDSAEGTLIKQIVLYNATRGSSTGSDLIRHISSFDKKANSKRATLSSLPRLGGLAETTNCEVVSRPTATGATSRSQVAVSATQEVEHDSADEGSTFSGVDSCNGTDSAHNTSLNRLLNDSLDEL